MVGEKRFVTFCFSWILFSSLCLLLEVEGHECSSRATHIKVTSHGGVLYSPGYPEEYPNSLSCTWLLTSQDRGKVLQLRPLDLKVGLHAMRDGTCIGDALTAYDGKRISSPVLHVWCGEDGKVVHSTGTSVLLNFSTDRRKRYRGFAMRYSLVTFGPAKGVHCVKHGLQRVSRVLGPAKSVQSAGAGPAKGVQNAGAGPATPHRDTADNSCEMDTVRTLPLQSDSAVVVDFTALPPPGPLSNNKYGTCSWRLVADDLNSQVVVDLERFEEGLSCEDCSFSVYDGPETSSQELVRWCARSTKPFSSAYLSGRQGMVVIRTRPNVTTLLRFRFYTRPKLYSQCSLSHSPSVELKGDDPVYITFPFAVTDSGTSCPVQILSSVTEVLWARIDVLTNTGGQPPDCLALQSAPPLFVLQTNETEKKNAPAAVEPTCLRWNQPVFWTIAESVIISPTNTSQGVLLKVTPAPLGACHGRLLRHTAPTDETLVIKDPPASVRTLDYSKSAWCRYLISGENEADHVLVSVEGELCELKDTCGDFVRIYDGSSTDSPLIYDSANRTHVTVHVISTGRHVTFELGTDDKDNRGFIQAEFNSVPGPELCSEVQQIKASRLPHNLSSINYPHYYPVNYMCQYCITSDNPEDVIYIQVIDSDMSFSCSDVVEVYDGANSYTTTENLGRFCAQDRPRYVSTGPGLCLLFRSDPSRHGRGWLLSYRAAPPTVTAVHSEEGSNNMSSGPSTTTTATAVVALVVLIAVIVVFIVYIVKNKRRDRSSSV